MAAMAETPRPVPPDTVPFAVSEATRSQPALRIPVGIGHSYREKATGRLWILAGLRSGRTVILISGDERRDRVSVDTALSDEYEHAGCDHDGYCCDLHGTHVTPHQGCLFR